MIISNDIVNKNHWLFLGRFYAFGEACKLDPTSSGRCVRQFKTALLQRLEQVSSLHLLNGWLAHKILAAWVLCVSLPYFVKLVQENETTLARRQKSDDAREMQTFYQHYYNTSIQTLLAKLIGKCLMEVFIRITIAIYLSVSFIHKY